MSYIDADADPKEETKDEGTIPCDLPCTPGLGYQKDIFPLFNEHEIDCMNRQGLNLADYGQVKTAATEILGVVKSGVMPKGGPRWSAEMVNTFCCWIQQGCQP